MNSFILLIISKGSFPGCDLFYKIFLIRGFLPEYGWLGFQISMYIIIIIIIYLFLLFIIIIIIIIIYYLLLLLFIII